jgi:glycosyltransferase involved in cell wall biosynthesis
MKVGIDATWAGVTGSGTATYTQGLVQGLAAQGSCDLVLYFRTGDEGTNPLWDVRGSHIEHRIVNGWGQIGRTLWSLARACAQDDLDVFHSPGYFLPLWRGPKVVTFHDLNMFRQWDKWWATGRRISWLSLCAQTVLASRLAREIVVDSHAGSHDIRHLLRVSPNRISVIYLGVDDRYFCPPDPAAVAKTRSSYDLHDYFLFVGVLSPLKNIEGIVRAFALLARPEVQLAIVGRPYGEYFEHTIRPLLHELRLEDRVRVLGAVPTDQLPPLYAGAQALLQPSFSEGFGLPPLEAMACGTPVMASNRPSMPEVLGDAALFVDPTDLAQMTDAMQILLDDVTTRDQLVQRGTERARQFRWDVAAKRMIEVYTSVAGSGGSGGLGKSP